jgi:aminoglycoside phosphotransferase (APT) family kinase protein
MNHELADPLAILAALGQASPARVTQVTGGADTAIWRVQQEGRVSALRVFRPEQAGAAGREVTVMAAAAARGLPAPAVFAQGTWQERPALLLSWMPGRPLAHELSRRPWQAWTLGTAFGRMQAAIHATPAPAALIDSAPWFHWGNPDEALRTCLLAHAHPCAALLHFDYHPLNILVADGRVTAVLDWTNARAGDPRADLARTAAILHFAPLNPALPAPLAWMVRRAFIAGWRRGYRTAAGSLTGMAPFYAWAGSVMIHDLTPRLGRADMPWLTSAFLDRVQAWTATWRERAECPRLAPPTDL